MMGRKCLAQKNEVTVALLNSSHPYWTPCITFKYSKVHKVLFGKVLTSFDKLE